jgi:hypothetical protein
VDILNLNLVYNEEIIELGALQQNSFVYQGKTVSGAIASGFGAVALGG